MMQGLITKAYTMHPMLNIAIRAARAAGTIITRSAERIDTLTVSTKSHNDFVSEIDHQAENEIIKTLRKAYPDHDILAEESGASAAQGRQSEYLWIIDPLDGTTNFLHGFPQFAVSIALQHRGVLTQAVVYDPLRQELFTATRGDGAQLNNRRLRVTKIKGLEGALLGTGFPFKDLRHLDAYLGMFKAMIPPTAGIRRAGSAALDLAYVASGRLDGFWEIGLKPWDMAAGALLIQEAGGMVTDFAGSDDFMQTGNVVTGNPKVWQEILDTIKPHLTDGLQK